MRGSEEHHHRGEGEPGNGHEKGEEGRRRGGGGTVLKKKVELKVEGRIEADLDRLVGARDGPGGAGRTGLRLVSGAQEDELELAVAKVVDH